MKFVQMVKDFCGAEAEAPVARGGGSWVTMQGFECERGSARDDKDEG